RAGAGEVKERPMSQHLEWLRGCGTALVTPFNAAGDVHEARLRALVERQISAGVRLLVERAQPRLVHVAGGVHEARLRALVERQISAGVRLLVPCGTTGEAATLTA